MSATSQTSGPRKGFTLSQIVALGFTYRHILQTCQWFPTLAMLTPFCLKVLFFLADGLTKNHSFITLCLTVCATIFLRHMTRTFAPSAKEAEESLAQYRLRIPLGFFVTMVLIVRFVIVRIEKSLGWSEYLTWSPSFSFRVAFQLALGMFFLGISVIFQYISIGPASVGEYRLCIMRVKLSFCPTLSQFCYF